MQTCGKDGVGAGIGIMNGIEGDIVCGFFFLSCFPCFFASLLPMSPDRQTDRRLVVIVVIVVGFI